MKKYITLLIFSLLTFTGLSQDNGITYQAVIYNPNGGRWTKSTRRD